MIKVVATQKDGTNLLILGLSHANLDRLRADGTKGFIAIKGEEIGIPGLEVVITASETEETLERELRSILSRRTPEEPADEKPEG